VLAYEFRGVSIQSFTSSLESTLSRSYGIRLAPIKPPYMFFSIIEVKKAL
jgi:hypothetical protein